MPSTLSKVFNRIILDRMKTAVEKLLRDHQAGFRKDRFCPDQIAAQSIFVEQSLEWKSSLYINFIDFENTFDSVKKNSSENYETLRDSKQVCISH